MKLLILLMLFSVNSSAQNQLDFKNDLNVFDSSLSFEGESEYWMLTVIGNIKNISNNSYQNLVIELKFFDKDGILIDTVTDKLYDNIFPANDSATFRIQGGAAKKPNQYISHKIRILSADIEKPCNSISGFKKFINEWGGFIVFISFMAFFIYSSVRYQKEEIKSKQKFMDMTKNQTNQLDRIANLVDNISKKNKD